MIDDAAKKALAVARQMGAADSGVTAYHGSFSPDIKKFDQSKLGQRFNNAASRHGMWLSTNPEDADFYGPHTYQTTLHGKFKQLPSMEELGNKVKDRLSRVSMNPNVNYETSQQAERMLDFYNATQDPRLYTGAASAAINKAKREGYHGAVLKGGETVQENSPPGDNYVVFHPETLDLRRLKASGGMIDDPSKAIRRAVLVAKGLSRAIGPIPGKDDGNRVHPASLIPGVHVQAIEPQNFAGGGEVQPTDETGFATGGSGMKFNTIAHADKALTAFNKMGLKTDRGFSQASNSHYLNVEMPGSDASPLKIRFGDHDLPPRYESPDYGVGPYSSAHGSSWLDAVNKASKHFDLSPPGYVSTLNAQNTAKAAASAAADPYGFKAVAQNTSPYLRDVFSDPANSQKTAGWVNRIRDALLNAGAPPSVAQSFKDKPGAFGDMVSMWQQIGNQGPTGAPTHNHAIFDPSMIDIKRKYARGGEVQPTDETGFDAFHGTPHSFEPEPGAPLGRFRSDKIGTGEGAQAFGHGLYVAGNEGVARSYRDQLSEEPSEIKDARRSVAYWMAGQAAKPNLKIPHRPAMDENQAIDAAIADMSGKSSAYEPQLKVLRQAKEAGSLPPSVGHIYHVRVNANPEHFLDWDKPLSEQHPHVKRALGYRSEQELSILENRINELMNAGAVEDFDHEHGFTGAPPRAPHLAPEFHQLLNERAIANGFNGRKSVEKLVKETPNRAETSAALHAAGIPGIRYLDANSRGPTGNPTHNHVIFDPSIIDIKRRYKRGGGVGLPHKSDGGMLDDPKTGEGYATQTSAGSGQNGPEAGGLRGQGGLRGSQGVLPSSGEASGEAPLEGLPRKIKVPRTGATIIAGPDPRIRAIAANYAQSMGMRYNPPTHYAKVDEARGKRIADAYEAMPHDPQHPLVKASYEALARETMAQYEAAKRAGFKAEFWHPDKQDDPYADSPRYAVEDVRNNHHMYVFPTHAGYGSEPGVESAHENPLLRDSGERWNGHRVTVNDIFRAVHDYYGHAKEGVGFRGDGEENAWRSHAAMFSPLARLALGTETRGQNSWLNYGPHGATNKTASTEDTVFAPPKIGILPHWVHHEGAEDFMLPEDIHAMAQAYQRHRSDGGQVIDAGLDAVRRHRDAGGFNGGDVSVGPQTVKDPVRNEFPGIYGNPRLIAQEAATRVAPESPALKRLFGVNREDLHEIGKGRVGNAEPDIAIKDKPRGSLAAENIMTPENVQRLQDVLVEAGKHKPLQIGMDAWYVHDPAYKRIEELVGPDEAPKYYSRLNNVYGMMSPGSAVTTEINRGAAANYLLHHNRTPDFIKYAGVEANARKSMPDFPEDIMRVPGHAFHSTSHAKPLSNYVEQGKLSMQSPKVPLYIQSSGVPETGFQTRWPVPDAHFTRAVGMADTRRAKKDFSASMSMPEYQQAGPWFSKHVAKPVGLEGVPAQARLWGAMSKHTGVDTAIGSPKLEMIANHIMEVAKHHKITPEVARDLVLLGHVYYRGGTVVDKALEVVRSHKPHRR